MPRLEQHLTANKVGTNFTGDMRRKAKSISKTTVVDVLGSLSDGSRPTQAPAKPMTTATTVSTGIQTTGMGGGSGGGGSSY